MRTGHMRKRKFKRLGKDARRLARETLAIFLFIVAHYFKLCLFFRSPVWWINFNSVKVKVYKPTHLFCHFWMCVRRFNHYWMAIKTIFCSDQLYWSILSEMECTTWLQAVELPSIWSELVWCLKKTSAMWNWTTHPGTTQGALFCARWHRDANSSSERLTTHI